MDFGFHFNFGWGWDGHGLVSGSLLLVICRGGLLFYNLFSGVGVACFEILRGQSLFKFFFTLGKC